MTKVKKGGRGGTKGFHVEDGYYTTVEVARATGISVDTLQRWRRTKVFVPKKKKTQGKIFIYLYDEEEVKAAKALYNAIGPLANRVAA